MKTENAITEKPAVVLTGGYKPFLRSILKRIVDLQIKYNLFNNVNKFSKGDLVVYNWKAKAVIPQVVG